MVWVEEPEEIAEKTPYDIEEARKYWETVVWLPEKSYTSSEALALKDGNLLGILRKSRAYRYSVFEPKLVQLFGLTELSGKRILEIGCGAGHDAITMSLKGADVLCVDIVEDNIRLVDRYASLLKTKVRTQHIDTLLKLSLDEEFDIIYAMGVLHHIPNAKRIVQHLSSFVKDDGEWRVMLYTPEFQGSTESRELKVEYYTNTYTLSGIERLFKPIWYVWQYQRFHEGTYAKVIAKRQTLEELQ